MLGRKSKVITISLPEAMAWKLSQLSKKSGIPKSVLISRALLLLASDFKKLVFDGGEIGVVDTFEDIEQEYSKREA